EAPLWSEPQPANPGAPMTHKQAQSVETAGERKGIFILPQVAWAPLDQTPKPNRKGGRQPPKGRFLDPTVAIEAHEWHMEAMKLPLIFVFALAVIVAGSLTWTTILLHG